MTHRDLCVDTEWRLLRPQGVVDGIQGSDVAGVLAADTRDLFSAAKTAFVSSSAAGNANNAYS